MPFTTIEEVERYLAGIPKFQSDHTKAADFNLEKFKKFCAKIANPQQQFPAIHVAGTNGKGSTCRILASVYKEAGYKVGLYTSPHILQFNERFEVDGAPIPDEALISFLQAHEQLIEMHYLTYFEISTAIAFWWFSESAIDLGIIEVVLVGRLDATNIIKPELSVITSIALDHTGILGESLSEIAREKAGIIKKERPVVIGRLPPAARETIRSVAEERDAPVLDIDELQPAFNAPSTVGLRADDKEYSFKTPFKMPVQALNVALAWRVIHRLAHPFPVLMAQFGTGLAKINVGYGRFERLTSAHRWYFDGAHNLEAVKKLKEAVQYQGNISEAVLILSLMRDKISPQMMDEFSEFKNIYYYTLNTERAAPFGDITKWLPQVTLFPIHKSQQGRLLKELNSKLVIFAGSFYFYATVRDWMKTFC